jgi:hypothetical protein
LLQRALQLAMAAGNWQEAAALKARLVAAAERCAAGWAVQSRRPTIHGEAAQVYQMVAVAAAAPARLPRLTADGRVLDSAEEVEQEVVSYFEALFQGRHR